MIDIYKTKWIQGCIPSIAFYGRIQSTLKSTQHFERGVSYHTFLHFTLLKMLNLFQSGSNATSLEIDNFCVNLHYINIIKIPYKHTYFIKCTKRSVRHRCCFAFFLWRWRWLIFRSIFPDFLEVFQTKVNQALFRKNLQGQSLRNTCGYSL